MSGGGGRTRPRHVGQWRPNAAAPCRAVAAERGRAMSGGGGRTRPRHVGRWRPNAAAPCRAVAAERGRVMSGGGGGRMRPRHVGRWRPRAAAPCRVALMGHGNCERSEPPSLSNCPRCLYNIYIIVRTSFRKCTSFLNSEYNFQFY